MGIAPILDRAFSFRTTDPPRLSLGAGSGLSCLELIDVIKSPLLGMFTPARIIIQYTGDISQTSVGLERSFYLRSVETLASHPVTLHPSITVGSLLELLKM